MNAVSPAVFAALDPLSIRAAATAAAAERAFTMVPGNAVTWEDRAVLDGYAGLGPLSCMLDDGRGGFTDAAFADAGRRLRATLSPEDYEALRPAILTSYYTPTPIAAAMISVLERAGVGAGSRILEPGCGVGRMIGLAHGDWTVTGVEADPVAARIAQLLNPQARILKADLRDVTFGEEFEAVIGNVPFSDVKYPYGNDRLAVHDYFLARSLDALVPGGIAVLIASRYVLDKVSGDVRALLASKADLVDAVRLPSNVFSADGVSVVSDVLVFRKGASGGGARWQNTREFPLPGSGKLVAVNEHFLDNPERVLGDLAERSSAYGATLDVRGRADLVVALRGWVAGLPELAAPAPAATAPAEALPANAIEGMLCIGADGAIREVAGGRLRSVHYRGSPVTRKGPGQTGPRTAALIGLAELRTRLVRAQQEGAAPGLADGLREEGRRLWRAFVDRFGPLNRRVITTGADGEERERYPNQLGPFRFDPRFALVLAMEDYDQDTDTAVPAPILTREVISADEDPTHADSPAAGLAISLARRGRVDLAYVAKLCGQSVSDVAADLEPFLYRDPVSGMMVLGDAYLSGDVVEKLEAAQEAAKADPAFLRNVAALEAVQPAPIAAGEIRLKLGAPILTPADVEAFADHLFGGKQTAHIGRFRTGGWLVQAANGHAHSVRATEDFGTPYVSGFDLLAAGLNQRPVTVTKEIDDGQGGTRRVIDEAQTLAAREKLQAIRDAFQEWVFGDPARRDDLVARYNRAHNRYRARTYDGQHLTFPGLATSVTVRDYQANAIWRSLASDQSTMQALFVGAGKTLILSCIAMLSRRFGIARRPCVAVPNHIVAQFAAEVSRFFPAARVLAASDEDCTATGRQRFLAKVIGADADLIIIGHSAFQRIPVTLETETRFIRKEIGELRSSLADLEHAEGRSITRTMKRMIERRVQKAEARLKEALNEKKDRGVCFEDLGIDMLQVDECHFMKNLGYSTSMGNVAGISPDGSQRASDLLMKVRIVEDASPVKGPIVFATATPIANSIAELYTWLRYLADDLLHKAGIASFDAFAAAHCEVIENLEVSPDGATLRPVARLGKFCNLPELLALWGEIAEVVTADMVKLPVPEIVGGAPEIALVPMSDAGFEVQQILIKRLESIRAGKVRPDEDNALAVTTDGRLLGVDPRLVDPAAGPGEKLPAVADRMVQIYQATTKERGAQLAFLSVGVHPSKRTGFCAYDELIDLLVARGIPRNEIVTFREEVNTKIKEAKVHADIRQGRKRIVIASDAKAGVGLQIATRLAALHNICLPWRPCDLTQRIGRAQRFGNTYSSIEVVNWITEQSFDARLAELLFVKMKISDAVMRAGIDLREIDDISEMALTFNEMRALASGNPLLLLEAEMASELARLRTLSRLHFTADRRMSERMAWAQKALARTEREQAELAASIAQRDAAAASAHGDGLVVAGIPVPASSESQAFGKWLDAGLYGLPQEAATLNGITLALKRVDGEWSVHLDLPADTGVWVKKKAAGMIMRDMEDVLGLLGARARYAARRHAELEQEIADLGCRIGAPFPAAAMLSRLDDLHSELEAELRLAADQRRPGFAAEAAAEFEAMRGTMKAVADAPRRERDKTRSVIADLLAIANQAAEQVSLPAAVSAPQAQPVQSAPQEPVETTEAAEKEDAGQPAAVVQLRPRHKERAETRRGRPARSPAHDARQLSLFPDFG